MSMDTSMYRIVRGEELLRSKGKEPRNIDNKGKPIGTHVKGISAGHLTPKHKQVSADAWIELSRAHGVEAESRPVLGKIWKQGDYYLSADGFRLHRTTEHVENADQYADAIRYRNSGAPDFNGLVRSKSDYSATICTAALWAALHATRPFSRDSSNIVRFACERDRLTVSATSWELGDVTNWLDAPDYVLHGAPFEFAVNNLYAIDVLRGMGASFVLGAPSVYGEKPIIFECGKRLALLMTMHISRD